MRIKKVLNNNAVIAVDNNCQDIVITGLGLAFKKKAGDILEESKIERVFRLENEEVSKKLPNLLRDIPVEYVEITEEIIAIANKKLDKKINEYIYLTLTDHIHFAVNRVKKGLEITNPMTWEIRRFYKDEFQVGIEALEVIKNRLNVKLAEEEAASIAMHIINSELNEDMPNVVKLIEALHDTLNIIKYHFGIELDENSLHYQRMVTHLKFFILRAINGEKEAIVNDELFDIITTSYIDSYECSKKIKKYARQNLAFNMSKAELSYVTVHIERVIQTNKGLM